MDIHDVPEQTLTVDFYKTDNGTEPVREWLRSLPPKHRKSIGEDIKTVQFGWPVGMPVVRKLEAGLWEVRSRTKSGIARVLFTVRGDRMLLLHGFVKKSQKTPTQELETARNRKKSFGGLHAGKAQKHRL
jgi:phage-related protein